MFLSQERIRNFLQMHSTLPSKILAASIHRAKPSAHLFGHVHESRGFFLRRSNFVRRDPKSSSIPVEPREDGLEQMRTPSTGFPKGSIPKGVNPFVGSAFVGGFDYTMEPTTSFQVGSIGLVFHGVVPWSPRLVSSVVSFPGNSSPSFHLFVIVFPATRTGGLFIVDHHHDAWTCSCSLWKDSIPFQEVTTATTPSIEHDGDK